MIISGVGPALIDRICKIEEYPSRGGQAIVKESIKQSGGAAANTIFGLAVFGEKCRFYTTIGKDADGDFFKSSLEKVGVDVYTWITHPETGRVDIYVDKDGERTFFVHPNAAGIIKMDIEKIKGDYLYLDPFPSNQSFEFHLELSKKVRRCKVILNPGYPYSSLGFEKLKELLRYVDIVILSKPEFEMLGGSKEDFLRFVSLLVITDGENGSFAFTKDHSYYTPAFKTKVVDTTGAGDSFAAGFIKAMSEGFELDKCLKAGNFVASYNIQHYGARNYPEWEDVVKILKNNV